MPIFTPVTIDRFFEPSSQNLSKRSPPLVPAKLNQPKPNPHHIMSPALYATPDINTMPLPLPPDSQLLSSLSPVSPYVINYKRRVNLQRDGNNGGVQMAEGDEEVVEDEDEDEMNRLEVVREEREEREGREERDDDESETDEFFEFSESMSVTSEDASGVERAWKASTSAASEFFDACEETLSEGGATPSNQANNIIDELHEIRLTLLMETEKRKRAEEALQSYQNQWTRLTRQLSLLGLSLPFPHVKNPENDENTENNASHEFDYVMELCQQISVSRLVSDEMSKGISRAEMAAEMESVIQGKNFEISRLMDRVQYYEAANREMSQRNQEAMEVARQQRNRRRVRQKWIWCSVGLAVAIGSVAIAWSYLPESKPILLSEQKETSSADK